MDLTNYGINSSLAKQHRDDLYKALKEYRPDLLLDDYDDYSEIYEPRAEATVQNSILINEATDIGIRLDDELSDRLN